MDWKPFLSALGRSRLFTGIEPGALERLLDCIGGYVQQRERDAYFLMQGDERSDIAIIAAGTAVGERLLSNGNLLTVSEFVPGDVFGDVLSGSTIASIVSVRAKTDCTVVRFAFDAILRCCTDSREAQILLLRNLVNAIGDKYFALNERVLILVHGTLRGKIAQYLIQQSNRAGGADRFVAPHNREEMARYLSCERSALSREISRMIRDGLLDCERREFALLDRDALAALTE